MTKAKVDFTEQNKLSRKKKCLKVFALALIWSLLFGLVFSLFWFLSVVAGCFLGFFAFGFFGFSCLLLNSVLFDFSSWCIVDVLSL